MRQCAEAVCLGLGAETGVEFALREHSGRAKEQRERERGNQALAAYLWAWAENQVMAAVKCVPLGQSAGQRLLAALGERIVPLVEVALCLPEARWSNYTPGLAIASSRHETQYTRLFRS